jgi:D-glycero-D-manno-heptose 1,7-bisphosphate phosphatase
MTEARLRAVFLDRDGVLNALVPDPATGLPESPNRVEDLQLLPGVASALRTLRAAGYLLVCVTNQPAAAKGKTSVAELQAIQARLVTLLEGDGARIDLLEICLHHPDGIVPELSGPCECRKPAPGMLVRAASHLGVDLRQSWMVGDSESDVEAGRLAGCRTILVTHPDSRHRRGEETAADAVVSDLVGAASLLSDQEVDC